MKWSKYVAQLPRVINRYVLGTISPSWAINRLRYGRALKAYYEAGESSPLHRPRSSASGDATVQRAGSKLRDTSRWLEENYDVASGALDVLVNNTVGAMIVPEPLVLTKDGSPAEDVNDTLLGLFDDWIHACDVTGQHDYGSLTRLVARTAYRDGECFGRTLIGPVPGLKHSTRVPFSLEAFEPDFVPLDHEDVSKRIRQGIQVDQWGKPTKYFLHPHHPGDTGGLFTMNTNLRSIDASNVMHVKMVRRLHQLRGVSIFSTVLHRFDDLKEIDENERVASRVAAAMAGFIKKGQPDTYDGEGAELGADGKPKKRELLLEPGVIFDDLLPGEDVGTIQSNRPNNALIPFRDSQLRSAASGLMVSFSSLSKNYDGTWSAQRQELVEQFIAYRALSMFLVYRWCQPVWDGFVQGSILTGEVDLSNVDMATIYNVSHICPAMPWIDPLKELEALILAEENLYESKSSIIRKRGGSSPSQVYREIARDRQQLDKLGLEERARSRDSQQPDDADDEPKRTPTARAVIRSVRRRSVRQRD